MVTLQILIQRKNVQYLFILLTIVYTVHHMKSEEEKQSKS